MANISSNYRKVMELLLEGKVAKAREFVENDLVDQVENMRAELADLERERRLLNSMVLRADTEEEASEEPVTPKENRTLTKEERPEVVRQYALAVVKQKGNSTITPTDVAERITSEGIDLGSEVPNTVIGNVLFNTEGWERVGKGVFRYKGEQLDLRGVS